MPLSEVVGPKVCGDVHILTLDLRHGRKVPDVLKTVWKFEMVLVGFNLSGHHPLKFHTQVGSNRRGQRNTWKTGTFCLFSGPRYTSNTSTSSRTLARPSPPRL